MYNLKDIYGEINFVIPLKLNNNGSRNIFINNLINNKLFSENTSLKYRILDDVSQVLTEEELTALVIFNDSYTDYTIRVPGQEVIDPDSPLIDDYYQIRKNNYSATSEYSRTFSPLQVIINQAIIQTKTNKTFDIDIRVGILSAPKIDEYEIQNKENSKNEVLSKFVLLPLIFFIPSMSIMTHILNEKEKGQEQGLVVVGVHPSTIWLSWEIFYLPLNIYISLLIAFGTNILNTINCLLGFMLIFVYGLSSYGLSVIFTKIFKKTKTSVLIISIFYFCLVFTFNEIYKLDNKYPLLLKLICVLIPPINLNVGLTKIVENKDHFLIYLILNIASVIIQHIIILCLDFYSFKISNIFKRKGDFTPIHIYDNDIEEDPNNDREPMVEVKNIFKIYKKRSDNRLHSLFSNNKVSVLKDVSFNVYKNEIFGILGHNGAGKSTLIKIMTGLLKADHGSVYYEGSELVSNVNKIRKNIGKYLILSKIYYTIY